MTEHSLWDGSEVPANLNASDGGTPGVVTGTGCLFGPNGAVVGVQFRATTTVNAGETYTVALWQMDTPTTGTLLSSKSVLGSVITDSTWNRVDFDEPVTVDDEHAYLCGLWQSGGRYVFTQSYFSGVDRGSLSTVYAWGTGDDISPVAGAGFEAVTNGRSLINTDLAFPTSSFSGSCFFVGPIWEDTPASEGDTFAVSGTIAATSTASLTVHRVRPVSGAIAGVSGATLTAHRVRPVSGTIAAHSTASLRLTGSATMYVKRGGATVQVTGQPGAVKRGGQTYAFG